MERVRLPARGCAGRGKRKMCLLHRDRVAASRAALSAAWRSERCGAGSSATSMLQFKELGNERESTEKWGYEKLMAALREQLSEAEIEKLAAEGAAWSEDRAVDEALKV